MSAIRTRLKILANQFIRQNDLAKKRSPKGLII